MAQTQRLKAADFFIHIFALRRIGGEQMTIRNCEASSAASVCSESEGPAAKSSRSRKVGRKVFGIGLPASPAQSAPCRQRSLPGQDAAPRQRGWICGLL
jgi:hypothetical protein